MHHWTPVIVAQKIARIVCQNHNKPLPWNVDSKGDDFFLFLFTLLQELKTGLLLYYFIFLLRLQIFRGALEISLETLKVHAWLASAEANRSIVTIHYFVTGTDNRWVGPAALFGSVVPMTFG